MDRGELSDSSDLAVESLRSWNSGLEDDGFAL